MWCAPARRSRPLRRPALAPAAGRAPARRTRARTRRAGPARRAAPRASRRRAVPATRDPRCRARSSARRARPVPRANGCGRTARRSAFRAPPARRGRCRWASTRPGAPSGGRRGAACCAGRTLEPRRPARAQLPRARGRAGSNRILRCRAPRRRPRRPGCRQQASSSSSTAERSRSTASCALPCTTAAQRNGNGSCSPRGPSGSRSALPASCARISDAAHAWPGNARAATTRGSSGVGFPANPSRLSATAPFAASSRRVASAAARAAAPVAYALDEQSASASRGVSERRRDTGSPERLAAVQHVTVELGAAEAHEGQGEMGERREICLSDRADRRHDRVHAALEHRDEGVDDLRRHAGAADREARDAREERRAHQLGRGRRAERGRAPDENATRPLRIVGRQRQPDVGTEARCRAVDALAVRGRPPERRRGSPRCARAPRRTSETVARAARDRDDVLDRGRSGPDRDPLGGRRAQPRPCGAERSGPFETGTIRRGLSCGCVR